MSALERLNAHRPKAAPIDPAAPVRPAWMTDREAVSGTAKLATRRGFYRVRRFLFHLPALLFWLVYYSPRGLGRVVAVLARYLYDFDSAQVRHTHAEKIETKEYLAAQRARAANLRARWMVAGSVSIIVVAPFLAWTFPWVLSGIVGFALFYWTVKLIPGRHWGEYVAAVVIGVAAWYYLPRTLELLPAPPWWVVATMLTAAVLTLGWYGRPTGKNLVQRDDPAAAGIPDKPSAPIVIDALCRLGIGGLTDKTRDEVRVFAPGVARSKRGYHLAMELPAGCTAAEVMDRREQFAAALRRELGTVWPSKGDRHPGHLLLFISDQPMATAPQSKWRVTEGKALDIFDPIDLFTDQEGQWVPLTLAYSQIVVGGAPGYGKTFGERQIGVAAAFDPRVQITTMDGKGNGDLRPLRLVAHGFYEGDEDDEIADQLAAVKAIREEMRRRARFLRDLPREENPLNKVTTELVDRYPHLAPILLLVDECQVYTEHENKEIRDAFTAAFTDLVKRGRSAGVIPVFCTQKPDAKALPSGIADNCSIRLCFRVNSDKANNQVLGPGSYASGIKATLFTSQDKGLAWLRGDGADPQVVRTVFGLDGVASEELMLKAREIRERRGLLTGYAAGEEADREEIQVDLLADSRAVMDHPPVKAMHLAELRDALALLRPGVWAHLDNDALGSLLRSAGVRLGTVWSPARKSDGRGVKRDALNVAATADVDPDEDPQAS